MGRLSVPRPEIEAVRAAYESLTRGDVEPLVALMDGQVDWRGRLALWRPWRPPPS